MTVRYRLARSLRLRIASMVIDAQQLGAVLNEKTNLPGYIGVNEILASLDDALDEAKNIEGYLGGLGEDEELEKP